MKKRFIIILVIVFAFCCSACGRKEQVEELNAHIQRLEEQLGESDKTIEDLQTQVATLNQTIDNLKKQLEESEKPNTTSKKKDTYDSQLGTVEAEIFNLLTTSLYRFDNPASVRVVKFHAYRESEESYFVTLTSENFLGGNLTDLYELSEDGAYGATYTEKQLSDMRTILGLSLPSCDVSQINNALEQYCKNQGLYQENSEAYKSEEKIEPSSKFSGSGSVSGGGTFKKYSFD